MDRKALKLEYPLGNASESVLWRMIENPLGLTLWFSEAITIVDDHYTFIWDRSEQSARLLGSEENHYIRFQWEDDEGSDYYFQFEIISDNFSKQITFVITDFVTDDEKNDVVLLWDKQVDDLKRKCGI